jgi:hypothetical protein
MKKIYSLIILATVLMYSCKTATKAFEKGDYEDAVELAVRKLQKDGNDAEAKAIAKNAYKEAVDKHHSIITSLNNSSSDGRFEKIYNEYRKLQHLYEAVNNSPVAKAAVNPTDYSSYVQTYKEKTGEVYFDRGLALMDRGDKASFRQAYDAFRTAYRFKNDNTVKAKMDEAYDAAVVKVLLVTDNGFNNGGMYNGNYGGYRNNRYNSGFGNSYGSTQLVQNFQDNLVRNLRYQGNSDFVKFYTDWDARSNNVQPDEIMEMQLGRLDIGRYYDETNTRDVSNRVVVRQIVYKPDSVVSEYATVYGRITTTRRIYLSEGDLNIVSRDASGKYLWNDVVRGEHRFVTEFASFSGDERALSASDRALINNSRSNGYNQVREEDVVREVLRQIEYEAGNRFRSYYSRYY